MGGRVVKTKKNIALRTVRVNKNMTQAEVAKILKKCSQTYSKKERGIIPFTIPDLEILAKAFDVTVKELIDE